MKKNNEGFSLVELIVVIAIMVVMVGGTITYIGTLGSSKVKKCAKELESHITQTKVCAMSRSQASLTVYADDTGVCVKTVEGSVTDTSKIGEKNIQVSYRNTRGSETYVPVGNSAASGIELTFDRASGALKKMPDGRYCYGFKVTNGSNTYYVDIEPLTGKTSIR